MALLARTIGRLDRDGRVALLLVGLAAAMIGLAYASVPLYRLFCQVTGYGGTTGVATEAPKTILARSMTVRFDANVAPDLPIAFTPVERSANLHIGEVGLTHYRAKNLSDEPVTMSATYNVVPHQMGSFFEKVQCFCFIEQTLQPGEEVLMPVTYFISPKIAEDEKMDEVASMTLSYTFFRRDDPSLDTTN